MPALESATLLNGRYHVLRPIGRGGMGAVYEAVDLRLRNTVAVKEMTADGEDARQAFEREARLLAALRHGVLPVVIDYFIENDHCFLVMQYIEGEDLAAVLRRQGSCSQAEVQRWGAAVLTALVYLHGLDSPVIHRDIKPSNIKLTPRGDIVLLDFGLAKGQPNRQTLPAREDRSLYGFTPRYAPPEQLQYQGTDARSDLYALGATMYHLVAGLAPPSAKDRAAMVDAGRSDPLDNATTAETIGEPFARVIRRAMALDPAARFVSAEEMLRALRNISSSATEPARPNALFSRPPLEPPARTRRVDAATPSRAERGRVVDLIVQVRFADSPLLGLEDWPTKRKPDRIEQASQPVRIVHPVDPATGQRLPARLRIRLVAPDFEIRGAGEQVIDVLPDEYSQRVAFLMTPLVAGYCRVNVEVYAADMAYLGTLAVEAEVVADRVEQPPLATADLVLDVREGVEEHTAITTPAAMVPPRPAGEVPSAEPTTAVGSPRTVGAPAARPAAPAPSAPLPPPPSAPAAMRAPSGRVRQWAVGLSAAAVLFIGIQIWNVTDRGPESSAPIVYAPPPAAAPAPTAPPPTATPAPPPGAAAPASAGAGGPPPRPTTSFPAPPTGQTPAVTGGAPSSSRLEVTAAERVRSGVVRLNVRFVNQGRSSVRVAIDPAATRLTSAQGETYSLVAGGSGPAVEAFSVPAGQSANRSLEFAVPDRISGQLTLAVAPSASETQAARFPPVAVTVGAK